jgi:hypothetical protein
MAKPPEHAEATARAREQWRSLLIEEYKALREEVIASLASQQQILGFGAATLGLVIGPGLALWGSNTEATELPFLIVFGFFVPLLSGIVVVIWFGEVLRMIRAGYAVAGLESTLNDDLKEAGWPAPALSWESFLRDERQPKRKLKLRGFVINFWGVIAAFGAIALTAFTLALVRDLDHEGVNRWTWGLAPASIVAAALTGIVLRRWWEGERGRAEEYTRLIAERRASGNSRRVEQPVGDELRDRE